jgi:molybdopterin synthase catalytic subunit
VFRIVTEAIDPRELEIAAGRERGGVVTFLGVVRKGAEDGRLVSALRYEAYDEMALREFEAIGAEARERFGGVFVAIVHRVGEVPAGEISVAVLAAAAHRAAAFDACRYAIDQLKERAPIWKHELYADGSAAWQSNA